MSIRALPGAVILVARHGKVAYLEALGFQDREKKIPMSTDAIFRIASMTKPLTSVAVMMLVEEGRIQLYDSVSVYLPELKGLQVGVERTNAATGNPELTLEPAQREMTIQDLLRHTSGITYGIFGNSLVKQAYLAATFSIPARRWRSSVLICVRPRRSVPAPAARWWCRNTSIWPSPPGSGLFKTTRNPR